MDGPVLTAGMGRGDCAIQYSAGEMVTMNEIPKISLAMFICLRFDGTELFFYIGLLQYFIEGFCKKTFFQQCIHYPRFTNYAYC